jgi:hypothetical protein
MAGNLAGRSAGNCLASILQLEVPTAIYQLPQVTLNEISPETAADLAAGYEQFTFFKDTSGSDKVMRSGRSLGGVFAARGAEGAYAAWLKAAGGPYDGFLLASANCFARELHQVVSDVSAGRLDAARELSARLTAAVTEIAHLASALPAGNPFTNANKAIDHFFAFGPNALATSPPRLHAGSLLPVELLAATGKILLRHQFMPPRGYLQ